MLGLSAAHMLIFGIVVILLFSNQLPKLRRSLCRNPNEFQIGMLDCLRNDKFIYLQIKSIIKRAARRREIEIRLCDKFFRFHHRGMAMRDRWKKFLWSPKFWAVLGVLGCLSGLYFQRVAANGSGLWCLGLIFLGAAYLEQHEYWPG